MDTKNLRLIGLLLSLISIRSISVATEFDYNEHSLSPREVAVTVSVRLPDGTPVPDFALRISNVDGSALSRRLVQRTDSSGSTTFNVPLDTEMRSILVRPAIGAALISRMPARDRLAERVVCKSHYVIEVPPDVARLDFPISVNAGRVVSTRVAIVRRLNADPDEVYFASPSSAIFPNAMLRNAYHCKDNYVILKNQTTSATAVFLRVGSHVSMKHIPAGSADVDLGVWQLPVVDFTPSNSICGRLRVSAELEREYAGIETGITFYNIDDCSIRSFDFYDPRKKSKALGGGVRAFEYQLCENNNPILRLTDPVELPPGRYVLIPGPMAAVDFQMKAIEFLAGGVDVAAFPGLFLVEVSAGQVIELGTVDFDAVVSYFKAIP